MYGTSCSSCSTKTLIQLGSDSSLAFGKALLLIAFTTSKPMSSIDIESKQKYAIHEGIKQEIFSQMRISLLNCGSK